MPGRDRCAPLRYGFPQTLYKTISKPIIRIAVFPYKTIPMSFFFNSVDFFPSMPRFTANRSNFKTLGGFYVHSFCSRPSSRERWRFQTDASKPHRGSTVDRRPWPQICGALATTPFRHEGPGPCREVAIPPPGCSQIPFGGAGAVARMGVTTKVPPRFSHCISHSNSLRWDYQDRGRNIGCFFVRWSVYHRAVEITAAALFVIRRESSALLLIKLASAP